MKRRTYFYDSHAFHAESFRRAQLASQARPAELQLIETPQPAAKFIDFPRVQPPVGETRPAA